MLLPGAAPALVCSGAGDVALKPPLRPGLWAPERHSQHDR